MTIQRWLSDGGNPTITADAITTAVERITTIRAIADRLYSVDLHTLRRIAADVCSGDTLGIAFDPPKSERNLRSSTERDAHP